MLVSLSTLAIGILAVFAAILYRIATANSSTAVGHTVEIPAGDLNLPAGARLIATALDGSRLAYTYDVGGDGTLTLIVDVRSGAVIGRVELGAEAPAAGQ